MEVFVARQPIFNLKNEVYAYELLYRHNEQNFFDQSVTSNVATSLLLMNSYYTFGIDKLVGEGKAFINFDKALIDAEIPKLLDKERVVIELLEDIKPDKEFVRRVKDLKNNGYTVAIDDYVEGYIYDELVELSDIIKVDFFENTNQQIISIMKRWKPKGKIMLAEKVETQEVYEWAKGLGFDLFQGYFFSKPAMLRGKGMTDSTYQFVRIMEELNEEEPNYKNIAEIIESDVTLTYKLLKLVNNNFTSSKTITSIQHGLSILGINAFEKWFSLAMVQNMGANKPSELVKLSMLRGHFMEEVAKNSKLKAKSNEMMLVGIISVIDALLERPIDEIVAELPLGVDIKAALLQEPGLYTEVFKMVLKIEKGNFDINKECNQELGINCDDIPKYYYEAVAWADAIFEYMNEE